MGTSELGVLRAPKLPRVYASHARHLVALSKQIEQDSRLRRPAARCPLLTKQPFSTRRAPFEARYPKVRQRTQAGLRRQRALPERPYRAVAAIVERVVMRT